MRRPRQNLVRILNPITNKHLTSARSAHEYVSRGIAFWTVFGEVIRFHDQAQIVVKSRMERDRAADENYWNQIIRERKGNPQTHELHFTIRTRPAFGTNVSGTEFRPCLIPK